MRKKITKEKYEEIINGIINKNKSKEIGAILILLLEEASKYKIIN